MRTISLKYLDNQKEIDLQVRSLNQKYINYYFEKNKKYRKADFRNHNPMKIQNYQT